MRKTLPDRRALLKLLGASGLAALTGLAGFQAGRATSVQEQIPITKGSFASPASYIIFKDGDLIKAKNGKTGQVEFSGTDAAEVIQSAIDALYTIGGGTIFLKAGMYFLNAGLQVKPRVSICGEGHNVTWLIANAAIDKLLLGVYDSEYPCFGRARIEDLSIDCKEKANYGIYADNTGAPAYSSVCSFRNVRICNALVAGYYGKKFAVVDLIRPRFTHSPVDAYFDSASHTVILGGQIVKVKTSWSQITALGLALQYLEIIEGTAPVAMYNCFFDPTSEEENVNIGTASYADNWILSHCTFLGGSKYVIKVNYSRRGRIESPRLDGDAATLTTQILLTANSKNIKIDVDELDLSKISDNGKWNLRTAEIIIPIWQGGETTGNSGTTYTTLGGAVNKYRGQYLKYSRILKVEWVTHWNPRTTSGGIRLLADSTEVDSVDGLEAGWYWTVRDVTDYFKGLLDAEKQVALQTKGDGTTAPIINTSMLRIIYVMD